ncbi:MAG: hypothetical protein LBJ47_03710 [Tannerella sp.]|jgi:hypothetical protein|nr:hypothetical protein [Tannerella sp.]
MEKNGLLKQMFNGVTRLAKGRRALYGDGTEVYGLKLYREGYEIILSLLNEAIVSKDAELMLLAEFFYTAGELSSSDGNEPVAKSSALTAVRKFEEALQALQTVVNPNYSLLHQALSTDKAYRHKGMPKDAFHVACLSDTARVRNGLSRMGLSLEDKRIARKRIELMNAAQDCYSQMQEKTVQK